jgi:hypothetical protein
MTGAARLWFAILVGPLAWLPYLQTVYALVASACSSQRRPVLVVIAAAAVLLAAAGAVVGRRALASLPAEPSSAAAHRARFMAVLGIASSLLFALAIAAGAIPSVVLRPCD